MSGRRPRGREAELLVVDVLDRPGVGAADGAVRVAAQAHLVEARVERVEQDQAADGRQLRLRLAEVLVRSELSPQQTEMVEAILKDKKQILPCSVYLEGEYGVRDLFVGVPVKLGKGGVEEIIQVKLSAEEAAAFQKIAPQLVGRETLHQRALAPPRFKMRAGDAAKQSQAADWKEHEIVSEYAFALLGRQIHELRQVTSVDGKQVAGERKAQDALAKLVTANDDERKRRALALHDNAGRAMVTEG